MSSEFVTTSTSPAAERWNFNDMPCGLAASSPSGRVGRPVASEKRTVTGTGGPANSAAVLSARPSAVGVNVPFGDDPLGVVGA